MKLTKILILLTIYISSVTSFETNTEKHRFRKKSNKFLNRKKKQSPSASPSHSTFGQTSDFAQTTNILDMVPDPDPSVVDLNIGQGPIHFSSWVKYFKYDSDEYQGSSKPRAFFKNNEFYQQSRKFPNADINEKKDGLYTYIKGETYFYMMVFYDRINILMSRKEKFQKTYESLTFDLIAPVVEEKDFAGGVTDFGAFAEGFCFKIQSSKKILTQIPTPDVPLTSWIICTETAREQGIIITTEVPPVTDTLGNDLNINKNTPNLQRQDGGLGVSFNSSTNNVTDGYWIVLQDWSQCSLKCGGGTSTLQRMCVPPKSGGKPCDGPAILTKPCNVQPCPQVKQLKTVNRTTEEANKKPIVKVMPFSDRPQRYTKCVVKESDLLYTKIFDKNTQYQYVENVQIPVRVVMNNKTLSIFQSSDYKSLLVSFDLQSTTFAPSKPHKNCFILTEGEGKESVHQAELCPFGFDRAEDVFQSWAYDFNLFKFQCHSDKETVELDNAEAKALDDKYKKKVEQAKIDIVGEKSKLVNEKLKKNEDKNIAIQMQKTSQMAMQAIQKELSLEDMIKREEEEKEKEAEREMLQEIDNEKRKHDCLVKAIKEKEMEDQFNIKTLQAEQQLQKIREMAAKEVNIKRSELKSAVMKMRKRAERKKAQLAQQLRAVRYQMANEMNSLYKDGDMNKCKTAMLNQQNKEAYCGLAFPDDYVKFTSCKGEDEDFCQICCENEFGNMHMDKRQTCIDTLCAVTPPQPENGRWVWTGENKDLIAPLPFKNTNTNAAQPSPPAAPATPKLFAFK